jgi:xanthine/CO dehydrogenase XdhC/CoxF family maturation factor
MHELHAILDAWRGLGQERAEAVLTTVVHVAGSAYRRPGARMLLLPDGRRVGSVSGGCLEGEISRKAWWFTESPGPVVRVYDTSSDDDAVWEFGLGCNGVVHVMLERANTVPVCELLDFVDGRHRRHETVAVAVVIAAGPEGHACVGDRLLVDAGGIAGGALALGPLAADVHAHARQALATRQSHLAHVAGHDLFVEFIAPPQDLVIFGAGDDAKPLVSMAHALGWRVTVADGRPAYATADRFPGAERVVRLAATELLRDIEITGATAVVMMTHNYPLDLQLMPEVLRAHPFYVGLLGPRNRAERLFAVLGLAMPPSVHAPVGLDLGGDTPAAVALAIASELQAVLAGRTGRMLRLRDEPIHAAVPELGDAVAPPPVTERPSYCETVQATHAA